MEQKVFYRYSMAFRRQVVDDIEAGRFSSLNQAREHYGIGNCQTIGKWVRRFGRNEILGKVVRVEKPDEKDQIRELKQRVKNLEQLLGRKEAQKVMAETFLEMACDEMGRDIEEFKKKAGMTQSDKPGKGSQE